MPHTAQHATREVARDDVRRPFRLPSSVNSLGRLAGSTLAITGALAVLSTLLGVRLSGPADDARRIESTAKTRDSVQDIRLTHLEAADTTKAAEIRQLNTRSYFIAYALCESSRRTGRSIPGCDHYGVPAPDRSTP